MEHLPVKTWILRTRHGRNTDACRQTFRRYSLTALRRLIETLTARSGKLFNCRQPAVPFGHGLGQRARHAAPHPDHGALLDTELRRDGISRLEANATNVARWAVRVLRHHLHRIAPVGFVDADRVRRSNSVLVRPLHEVAVTGRTVPGTTLMAPRGTVRVGHYEITVLLFWRTWTVSLGRGA